MQHVASFLAGEGLRGADGRAYWVVKWRGVGVYLLGTSAWQGHLYTRRRREGLCPCISDSLLGSLLKTPFSTKLCTILYVQIWRMNRGCSEDSWCNATCTTFHSFSRGGSSLSSYYVNQLLPPVSIPFIHFSPCDGWQHEAASVLQQTPFLVCENIQ